MANALQNAPLRNRPARSFAAAVLLAMFALPAAADDAVDFNRDIRPIFSDYCYACHGPDERTRRADLRLDVEESATREWDGVRLIAPGDVEASDLHRRLVSDDPDVQMPPPDAEKQLAPAQIELIARWIRQGAKWQEHWAFVPPRRPVARPVDNAAWLRNPIDGFVLARLEKEGLSPAPEADRTTLIRRVTFELTGLPPTPEEVDAFLADDSPEAYERVVDRLLASPRYGERMAARWLDAARYADTNGYQDDGIRHMWRWRDWVIEAYNRNVPFDQFTIEQIAGDLLHDPTLEQHIATGFNRNHRTNAEGGIIPEEYAVEYVVDRVDTTATVWLGLTMGCARCHDHKYDPFTQREYYGLFAYFNNVPERGRGIKVGNSPPAIKAPTRDQQRQLAAIDEQLAVAQAAYDALGDEVAAGEAEWAESFAPKEPVYWAPADALAVHVPLDGSTEDLCSEEPAALNDAAAFAPGALGQAAEFDGQSLAEIGDRADFGFFDAFTISAWILPRGDQGTIVARMADVDRYEGYSVELVDGKLQGNFSKRWLDDALRVETREPLEANRWHHIAVVYDGSRLATGVHIYVDGQERQIDVLLDGLNQSFQTKEPLRIGGGGRSRNFDGLIDDVRIYETDLPAGEIGVLATRDSIGAIAALSAEERTPGQAAGLRDYYLTHHAPPHVQPARARVRAIQKRRAEFEDDLPTTMVMVEMPTPRQTHVLKLGQYNLPRGRVTPDVPSALHQLPRGAATNRLGFAHWLVDPANPLTARVAVNRFWQSYFGTGLVKTVDDFGAQGEVPSHPDLLDWLATEFVARDWDMKAMARLIVTSATYRQSSIASEASFAADPQNRLLSRGPRLRLPAEMIRDAALAASGLLVEQLGGPSVKPYQPPGLWKELTGGKEFEQDHGAGLYRRSLYTYWKRTIAPPSMITFDASPRESCTVRQSRTNTPLQALTLLNETTFVEAARQLAQRVMRSDCTTPAQRLELAFRLVLSRPPNEQELQVLVGSFESQAQRYRAAPEAATALLAVGESQCDTKLDSTELAAYAAVANLIFNLDESVTKE